MADCRGISMKKIVLKIAKIVFRNIEKFGLSYQDPDVEELGKLIQELDGKEESE